MFLVRGMNCVAPHWAACALIQLLSTASKLLILPPHALHLDLIRCGLSPQMLCLVQAGYKPLISPKSAFPGLWIKPFNYITCRSLRLLLSDLLRNGCFFKKKTNPNPHWRRMWLFFCHDSPALCIATVCGMKSWFCILPSELTIIYM